MIVFYILFIVAGIGFFMLLTDSLLFLTVISILLIIAVIIMIHSLIKDEEMKREIRDIYKDIE